jgi:hypothetical protein
MLKKSFAFGLFAAGMMIAPGAAFALDIQNSDQNINQLGVANGFGNTVVNTANQQNNQNINNLHNGYGYCPSGLNVQNSNQNIAQTGIALGANNTVVNQAAQANAQNAANIASGYGYGCY